MPTIVVCAVLWLSLGIARASLATCSACPVPELFSAPAPCANPSGGCARPRCTDWLACERLQAAQAHNHNHNNSARWTRSTCDAGQTNCAAHRLVLLEGPAVFGIGVARHGVVFRRPLPELHVDDNSNDAGARWGSFAITARVALLGSGNGGSAYRTSAQGDAGAGSTPRSSARTSTAPPTPTSTVPPLGGVYAAEFARWEAAHEMPASSKPKRRRLQRRHLRFGDGDGESNQDNDDSGGGGGMPQSQAAVELLRISGATGKVALSLIISSSRRLCVRSSGASTRAGVVVCTGRVGTFDDGAFHLVAMNVAGSSTQIWLDTSASVPRPLMLPPAACVVRGGCTLRLGADGRMERRRAAASAAAQEGSVVVAASGLLAMARVTLWRQGLSPVQLLRLGAGADGGGASVAGSLATNLSLAQPVAWPQGVSDGYARKTVAPTPVPTPSPTPPPPALGGIARVRATRRVRALLLQVRAWRHAAAAVPVDHAYDSVRARAMRRAHADEVERERLLAQLRRTVSPTVPPTPVPSPAPSQSPTPFVTPAPTPPTQAPTPPTPSPTPLGCAPGHYMPRGVQGPASATCFPCPAGKFGPGGLARADPVDDMSQVMVARCESCAPGAIAATVGRDRCVECPCGRVAPHAASRVCTACEAGRWAPRGSAGRPCQECGRRHEGGATAYTVLGGCGCAACLPCNIGHAGGVRRVGCGGASHGHCVCPAGKILRAASPAQLRRIRLLATRSVSLAAQEAMRAAAASSGAKRCVGCAHGKAAVVSLAPPYAAGHQSGGWDGDPGGCGPCGPGRYVARVDAHGLVQDAGLSAFFTTKLTSAKCVSCPAGRFATGASSRNGWRRRCKGCAAARFAAHKGARRCERCPAGKHAGAVAAGSHGIECALCSAGMSTDATAVPSGQSQSRKARQCVQCAIGRVQPQAGRGRCLLCPAGRFAQFDGLSCGTGLRGKCPGGRYGTRDRFGMRRCAWCKAGPMSAYLPPKRGGALDSRGWRGPSSLPPGTLFCGAFACHGMSNGCQKCPPTEALHPRRGYCVLCPAGKHVDAQVVRIAGGARTSTVARLRCAKCARGRVAPRAGMLHCMQCTRGKVSDTTSNSTRCTTVAREKQKEHAAELSRDPHCVACLSHGRPCRSTLSSTGCELAEPSGQCPSFFTRC